MIDPWPRYVENKNIVFNGERAQAAVERYRRDCVFVPVNPTTTSLPQQQTMQQAAMTRCQSQNQVQTVNQGVPAAARSRRDPDADHLRPQRADLDQKPFWRLRLTT